LASGSGRHRGKLQGGCLEVIDWLRGTIVWPRPAQWQNTILFLETSEDQPFPTLVTHMLRSLTATGVLKVIRGILFGRPYGDDSSFQGYDDALLRVLAEQGCSLFRRSHGWILATPIQSSLFPSALQRK
jgi:muramoyltetrapeptide carboxypeptidase LdcA involved in peptidoglycan recycling